MKTDYAINLQSYDTHINLFGICIQDQLLVIKAVSSSWFNDLLGNFNKNVVLIAWTLEECTDYDFFIYY